MEQQPEPSLESTDKAPGNGMAADSITMSDSHGASDPSRAGGSCSTCSDGGGGRESSNSDDCR